MALTQTNKLVWIVETFLYKRLSKRTLDVIADRCGYDLSNHHHALADAKACAAIALEIL